MLPMHFGGEFEKANAAKAAIEACGVTFLELEHYGQELELED